MLGFIKASVFGAVIVIGWLKWDVWKSWRSRAMIAENNCARYRAILYSGGPTIPTLEQTGYVDPLNRVHGEAVEDLLREVSGE